MKRRIMCAASGEGVLLQAPREDPDNDGEEDVMEDAPGDDAPPRRASVSSVFQMLGEGEAVPPRPRIRRPPQNYTP